MKILITDKLADIGVQKFKEAGFEVVEDFETKGAALGEKLKGFDALIVRSGTQADATVINASEGLKVIGRAGAGLDNVDQDAAKAKGITVLNSPEGNTVSAAEHTCAMLLALCRKIPQAHISLNEGRWDRKKFKGAEVCNKTLGVIGLGRIGLEVAKRMKCFEMKIIASDPFASDELFAEAGAEKVEFNDLIAQSDFISVHVPKNEKTINLIGAVQFKQMKDSARIVNVARGGIVNEKDLVEALKNGEIAGAAIDVYEKEPIEYKEMIGLENVVHTPHLGASTSEAQTRCGEQIAEKVIAELKG